MASTNVRCRPARGGRRRRCPAARRRAASRRHRDGGRTAGPTAARGAPLPPLNWLAVVLPAARSPSAARRSAAAATRTRHPHSWTEAGCLGPSPPSSSFLFVLPRHRRVQRPPLMDLQRERDVRDTTQFRPRMYPTMISPSTWTTAARPPGHPADHPLSARATRRPAAAPSTDAATRGRRARRRAAPPAGSLTSWSASPERPLPMAAST